MTITIIIFTTTTTTTIVSIVVWTQFRQSASTCSADGECERQPFRAGCPVVLRCAGLADVSLL